MAAETRSTFKTGVSAVIYNNTQKLIKGNTVRDKFLVIADSVLFFEEANVGGGYLEIDQTNLNVDVSFIKATSPTGKFLKDNGTWDTIDSFPTQSGNSGKFLTTNGSTTSWATVDTLPSQSGHSGKFLKTNGSAASWVAIAPGGADDCIQFAVSGSFSGSTRLVWEDSNRFFKVDGMSLFGVSTANDPTACVDIASSTSSQASLRIRDGSGPSSPNNGDIWQDGSDIWIFIGGSVRQFMLV